MLSLCAEAGQGTEMTVIIRLHYAAAALLCQAHSGPEVTGTLVPSATEMLLHGMVALAPLQEQRAT